MTSITIHNIPKPLATLIRAEAKKQKTSLNQIIKRLLEKALAVSSHKKHDFSEFYGVWTNKDLRDFERATGDFEQIDWDEWK